MDSLLFPTAHKSRSKSNKARKKEKSNQTSSNLEEQWDGSDSNGSKKHTKSMSTKMKDPEPTHQSSASDVNVNAVPDPVPDTGLSSVDSSLSPFTVHTGVLPVIPSSTLTVRGPTQSPGFSPLPPFLSLAATTTVSSISASSTASILSGVSSVSSDTKQAGSQSPKHLSTAIIVLIAIGVAFLLFLVIILLRACAKPRRRSYPTPSLPILQDFFSDKNPDGDEESLFGGKERISGRPGSNGLWTWTQYSQPSVAKPDIKASEGLHTKHTDASQISSQSLKGAYPCLNESVACLPSNDTLTRAPPRPPPAPENLHTPTRVANRLSVMSTSVYPGSPHSTQGGYGIGIAVGAASPLTADGMPMLQRSASKVSTRRLSRGRRSMQYGVHEKTGNNYGDGNVNAYDGLQITSPSITAPTPVLKKSNSVQGRARIKAPYATGALRTSTSAAAHAGTHSNPFDDSQYVLPPLSPVPKSDALRERNTRALTSALGLASPVPPSPQPTLYPDDSVTLAGGRRETRRMSQMRPQSQTLSPGTEASARLGNLMLAEFSSMTSMPSARTLPGTGEAAVGGTRNKSTRKRTEDKPPRVPSPPPMPSLAQMALSHSNPEEYADYRSPTYSIYGLYEADRKSRAPGEGGY